MSVRKNRLRYRLIELEHSLAIYKARDEAKQLVIEQLERQLKELTTPREVTPRLWHLDKSLKVHW